MSLHLFHFVLIFSSIYLNFFTPFFLILFYHVFILLFHFLCDFSGFGFFCNVFFIIIILYMGFFIFLALTILFKVFIYNFPNFLNF